MTVNEILLLSSRDIARMSRSELAKITSQLSSAANKRLKRLEVGSMGVESPAYKKVMRRGEFSVRGKNQGQLQGEFMRLKDFFAHKSSSLTGWNEMRKKTFERIGGGFSTEAEERAFWAAYRKIEGTEQALHHSYGSTETQRALRNEMRNEHQLSDEEKARYMSLFPDDTSDLNNLTQRELTLKRTLILMGEDYEAQMMEEYENDPIYDFFRNNDL